MKLLVTGAHGQLGRALQGALRRHSVAAFSRTALDVTDGAAAAAVLERQRPDAVVHCAALTDTARCERDPDEAMAVNAYGTEKVAHSCARVGARLLAVSTNEVFDGTCNEPYAEDAPATPVNAYGRSKLEGERLAAATWADTLIVRTSWLYGVGGNNFVERVLTAASAGAPLRFVTDEVAAPTAASDLAAAIAALLEVQAEPGVYHLAGEGEASRWDWAAEVLRLANVATLPGRVTTAELRAGGYSGPQKPPRTVLANTRARALGIALPPWPQALRAYVAPSAGAHRG